MDWDRLDFFLEQIHRDLNRLGVDVIGLHLDHVCYRVATLDRYHTVKKTLIAQNAALLSEAIIGGRPIATFKLATPFQWQDREISIVEIPSPKTGRPYPEGWEHAEFVILESFSAYEARHPALSFDRRGVGKTHNPELVLELSDGKSVKFHPKALETVIAEELASC